MPYGTEALPVIARGASVVARGLTGANAVRNAGAVAVGVGVTAAAIGYGVKTAASGLGDGLLKGGLGLGVAYLVYRALKK